MELSDHERYLRLKALPHRRHTAATVAWMQGYEAGWKDAADRWLRTPQGYAPGDDDSTGWLGDEDAA